MPLAKPFPAERVARGLVVNQIKPARRPDVAKLGRDDRAALAAIVGHMGALEGLLSSASPLVKARAADELRRLWRLRG